jgi:glycosyltransferase involved in cell wall biosynthesis
VTAVSVVVPTRDRAGLLPRTLCSVLAQQDVDVEVLVVDDGSRDGTRAAVSALLDDRLRYLRHEQPQGVSAARNSGVGAATGTWVAFLDDDDLWAPRKLAAQLELAAGHGWAVSGAVCVNDELAVLSVEAPLPPQRIADEVERWNAVPAGASNVLVRAEVLRSVGPFDVRLRHMSDWDLWIRLARQGLPAVVPRPHVAYRMHLASATVETGYDAAEPLAELAVIAARYGVPVDRAAVHRWIGWSARRAGRRAPAAAAYLRAVAAGDFVSLLRASAALVHPALSLSLLRRRREDPWSSEAHAWLRDLPRC